MRIGRFSLSAFSAALLMMTSLSLPADEVALHKLAIHVDRDDDVTLRLAVNNAKKAWQELQPDIAIEVVTYGPGIALVTEGGPHAADVVELMKKGVKFDLCQVTLDKMTEKKGRRPELINGVAIVPSGTVKLMELQEQGYAYLRP